jgi:quinol monooxygenase YgiN
VPAITGPGVRLVLPYRSPTNPLLFFILEIYVNEPRWAGHKTTLDYKRAYGFWRGELDAHP